MNTDLQNAYRWHKQQANGRRPRLAGMGLAAYALALARADVAAGKARYPHGMRYSAPGVPFAGYGTQQMRWCESPADIGLRFVGYADKLARIDHTGWWLDELGDGETARGVVYRLPGRDGHARFVSGYSTTYNTSADNGGPAAIDFGTIWVELTGSHGDDSAGARAAAYHADKLAERVAETEREYNRAWQTGARWADLGEQIADTRKALLAMLAERRQAKADGARYPAICAALADRVRGMLEDISAWRSKRAELAAGDTESLYFYPSPELKAAFNEGAGLQVLA